MGHSGWQRQGPYKSQEMSDVEVASDQPRLMSSCREHTLSTICSLLVDQVFAVLFFFRPTGKQQLLIPHARATGSSAIGKSEITSLVSLYSFVMQVPVQSETRILIMTRIARAAA